MFSKRSRYRNLEQVEATDDRGQQVVAIKLRALGEPVAKPAKVTQGDQLDVISERRYSDGARYWHIADANSELEAAALLTEPARIIKVPER
ncbi:MAG: hypothetical protein WBM71_12195 [Sedimenticolaceae bacterium]